MQNLPLKFGELGGFRLIWPHIFFLINYIDTRGKGSGKKETYDALFLAFSLLHFLL